jgi:GT2 family glycosyltransferase
MKVGVLMTTRNCLGYTQPALQSIKSSHPLDIVIVDNGSNDGTRNWLTQNKYSWLHGETKNSLAGRWNLGLAHLFGRGADYVAVLNNDLLMSPVALDGLVECLQKHEDAFISCGENFRGRMADPADILRRTEQKDADGVTNHDDFCCFMIHRRCWETIGPLDEGFTDFFFEDIDYRYRVEIAGKRTIVTSLAPIYHYGRTSVKDDNHDAAFTANRKRFVDKWGVIR